MTQVNATYELCVDLTGDGDYADASEDISAYWKRISIQQGMSGPNEHMGRSSTMTVILNNASHQFSPQHASALSGFTKGARIRLRMTYSATTVTLYEGRIDHIQPVPGATKGSRETVIRCDGFLARMQQFDVRAPLRTSARGDTVLADILDNLEVYPATATGWFLGVSGFSELGATTYLRQSASGYASLDTSANTYDYAADSWHNASAYAAIRDLVESERGWFYEARDGTPVFWGRHHLAKDLPNAVDATLNDNQFDPVRYTYGETMVNDATVNYRTRGIGKVGVVLATYDAPRRDMVIVYGQPKTFTLKFVDPETGAPISGMDIIKPVAGFDYFAKRGVTDASKACVVTMRTFADRAEITFENNGSFLNHKPFFIFHLRVRGTQTFNLGEQKVNYRDDTSIISYGRFSKNIEANLLQDAETARDIAAWEVANGSIPSGNLEQISFYANKDATMMGHARDRVIGDRIAASEGQTGANNEYFIFGKRIELTPQNIHKEDWILAPKPVQNWWLLGTANFGNLGASTTIGA